MTEPIPGFPDSLMTPTPETGFQLAIKLSRLGVKVTQPDGTIVPWIESKTSPPEAAATVDRARAAVPHARPCPGVRMKPENRSQNAIFSGCVILPWSICVALQVS